MLPDFAGSSLLLVCLALAPACARLWRGRALSRLASDAALGERLVASHRQNTIVLSACLATSIVFEPGAMTWVLPLTIVSYLAAAYPLRRAVYGETWRFGTYLWFTGRLLVAFVGFWILLAAMPIVVHAAGPRDWAVGLLLGAGLFGWNSWYAPLLRGIMRARPLTDATLIDRFTALTRQFELPQPRFEQIEVPGGFIPNAVALASRRGSSVVFTDSLLNLLTPDETVAICAHELAHIEYYNPQRLRRMSAIVNALIATAVLIPVGSRLAGAADSVIPWILWAGVLFSGLMWLARDRQKNETASDVRAATITGDPEGLIRALVKLYAAGRMPRRLQLDLERHATHPSLARRIRDIRAAAGVAGGAPPPETTIVAPDAQTRVVFDRERLHWHEGDAATHSLRYSHLSELRVHARGTGQVSLVAIERGGRRWEAPLAAADVAAVQAALDAVDGQLGAPVAQSRWPSATRAVAALAVMFALGVGQVSAVLVAAFALMHPTRRLRAAAGLATIAGGCLALRSQLDGDYPIVGGFSVLMSCAILALTAGTALIILAVARPEEPASSGRDVTLAFVMAMGTLAALSVGLLMAQARDVLALHLWSRSLSAAVVMPLALAGALAFWSRRAVRYLSLPVAAIGVLTMGAGFPAFLDAFGRDPLLVSAAAPVWKTLAARPVAEFRLEVAAAELRLSPGARHMAVTATNEMEEDAPGLFHLGPAGGRLVPVAASDLIFLDDEHVLVLQAADSGFDLRLAPASAPAETLWRQHIGGLLTAQLSVGRDGKTWHVVGSESSGRLVRVEGRVGTDAAAQRRWTSNAKRGAMVTIASSGPSAVAVETRYNPGGPPLGLWQLALFMPTAATESYIWAVDSERDREVGVSRLDVRCVGEQRGAERLACIAFDGTRSRVFSIDPETRRLAPVIQVDGRLYSYSRLSDGWLTGWHVEGPMALRLDTREAYRPASSPYDAISQLAPADRVIGALCYRDGISTVRLYALE